MNEDKSLAEQDVRVARIGEVSLRMMAGVVGDETLAAARERVAASRTGYPWEDVVRIVNAQTVDPSELFNRALDAQRAWLDRDGGVVAGPEARPAPVRPATPSSRPAPARASDSGKRQRPRSFGYHVKRLIAVLLVRGIFYGIALTALLVILVLLERRYPDVNIYELAASVQSWFEGLTSGG